MLYVWLLFSPFVFAGVLTHNEGYHAAWATEPRASGKPASQRPIDHLGKYTVLTKQGLSMSLLIGDQGSLTADYPSKPLPT